MACAASEANTVSRTTLQLFSTYGEGRIVVATTLKNVLDPQRKKDYPSNHPPTVLNLAGEGKTIHGTVPETVQTATPPDPWKSSATCLVEIVRSTEICLGNNRELSWKEQDLSSRPS
jgi:hypothetical protein